MNKFIHIILALLLPPIAVFLKSGVGKDLLINIVLCLFFYVPGILHALWLIKKIALYISTIKLMRSNNE